MNQKKNQVAILSIIFLFVISADLQAGGPWAIGKKKGFTQLGLTLLNYSSAYNTEGKSTPIGTEITDNTLQFYGEYGLTDKFTLKTSLPLKLLEESNASVSLNGLGNWVVGGKYLLIDKKVKLSGGLDLSLPTISTDDGSGLRTGYEALGVTPYFSVGGGKSNLYAFLEGGVNFNTNGYSNNGLISAEVGFSPVKNLWIATFSDIRQSFEDGDFQNTDNINYSITSLYVNDQSYVVSGFKVSYTIKDKFGVNFSRVFAISSAESVAASLPLNVGVFMKW